MGIKFDLKFDFYLSTVFPMDLVVVIRFGEYGMLPLHQFNNPNGIHEALLTVGPQKVNPNRIISATRSRLFLIILHTLVYDLQSTLK